MASTIVQPNVQILGNYGPAVAKAVSDTAAAAIVDINALQAGTTIAGASFHTVRNVVTSNVASLTAYTVTAAALNDNVSGGNVAGDRVLLLAQTTPAENGIYVVGTVASTTAPLTRATDWAAAAVLPAGSSILVNAGTLWASSIWFASVAGSVTVGTTAPAFYPKEYTVVTTAMSGTPGIKLVSNAYILSATLSSVLVTVKTPGTQGFLSVGTLAAGPGTGSFTVTSTANETSTLYLTIRN